MTSHNEPHYIPSRHLTTQPDTMQKIWFGHRGTHFTGQIISLVYRFYFP